MGTRGGCWNGSGHTRSTARPGGATKKLATPAVAAAATMIIASPAVAAAAAATTTTTIIAIIASLSLRRTRPITNRGRGTKLRSTIGRTKRSGWSRVTIVTITISSCLILRNRYYRRDDVV